MSAADWPQQFRGKVRQQWGKLTDDDLDVIEGRREELAGRIQMAYGISKDEAERQIERFETFLSKDRAKQPDKDSRDQGRAHQG